MNELDKQEAEQIAIVEAASRKAVQTIKDYFAMQRSFLGGFLHSNSAPTPSVPAPISSGSGPKRTTAKMQDTIGLVLKAIHEHPAEQYTFPEIKTALAHQGISLSRDQLRRVMEAIIGKAPVFQVSPRSGSVAGVYSKVPVAGNNGINKTLERIHENLFGSRADVVTAQDVRVTTALTKHEEI